MLSNDELINLFKTIHGDRKRLSDELVTVGLVGYPNVGKSSTINTLLAAKKVSVSSTPGKTKHFQVSKVNFLFVKLLIVMKLKIFFTCPFEIIIKKFYLAFYFVYFS